MSNENKTIHDFDFNLICEYFSGVERQGPGSPEVTVKALSFVDNLSEGSKIADIGCGTGGQTMVLAKHAPGSVTGIDLFPEFISIFNDNAGKQGLANRVKGVVGSMDDLPFQDEELDLIWSEGAIYNIGFEIGLLYWKKFLKPGAFIAVTEAAWFTEERPEEIEKFWMDSYPGIETIPAQTTRMQNAGYIPVAHFILPESCWTENFFMPQVKAQEAFLRKHEGDQKAIGFIETERHEAELYSKYKSYYGYVFYIGKKI